jgi:hypothetical protein
MSMKKMLTVSPLYVLEKLTFQKEICGIIIIIIIVCGTGV